MKNKKVLIPIYEGMELKMTVDNGFLVAEYSEEEKQQLLEAMHKDGKDWDGKKVIDYVEPLKGGDICIFWDGDKSKADLCFLSKKENGCYEDILGRRYKNAIKCENFKQYKEFIK